MINTGGWLLIAFVLAGLLILVQRTESSRRTISLVIMLGVGYIVLAYGHYRMSGECEMLIRQFCALTQVREKARLIAQNTLFLASITAFILSFLFWALIGRYNPPGTSDSIRVLGLND